MIEAPATQQVSHDITLYPEPITHIGSFTITNTLLNAWVAVLIIIVIAVMIGRRMSRIPKGIQNVAELVVDEALKLVDSVTQNREMSLKVFPLVFSL